MGGFLGKSGLYFPREKSCWEYYRVGVFFAGNKKWPVFPMRKVLLGTLKCRWLSREGRRVFLMRKVLLETINLRGFFLPKRRLWGKVRQIIIPHLPLNVIVFLFSGDGLFRACSALSGQGWVHSGAVEPAGHCNDLKTMN